MLAAIESCFGLAGPLTREAIVPYLVTVSLSARLCNTVIFIIPATSHKRYASIIMTTEVKILNAPDLLIANDIYIVSYGVVSIFHLLKFMASTISLFLTSLSSLCYSIK